MSTLGNSRINSEISIKLENSQSDIHAENVDVNDNQINKNDINNDDKINNNKFKNIDYLNLILCCLLNMLCCLYWGYLPY